MSEWDTTSFDVADDISLAEHPEKVLLFDVGAEAHAIQLDRIRLVHRAESIRPLPQAPENVVGLLETQEEAIPVVDLAAVLGMERSETPEHVIIYSSSKGLVGFLVDNAKGVAQAVKAPLPQTLRRSGACLVALAKMDEGTAYLLDLESAVPGQRDAIVSRALQEE